MFFDKILLNRIKDLERTIEVMTGREQVLVKELERSQKREEDLLQKIFNLTGVNSSSNGNRNEHASVASMKIGGKSSSWPTIRENLELKAREEYWSRKNKEQEIQKDSLIEDVEKLEKETLS